MRGTTLPEKQKSLNNQCAIHIVYTAYAYAWYNSATNIEVAK